MALASRYENPTRRSLLSRVKKLDDQESWKELFASYSKLVYSVAIKAGLDATEAEEVVQETFITLTKSLPKFQYDPKVGSFKGWLIHTTQFKIADQLRKRKRFAPRDPSTKGEGRTATIERIADPASLELEKICEEEWRENLLMLATEKVKGKVSASQFQIFDLFVLKHWPVRKIAITLGINSGRVYLAKHRVAKLVKREIHLLQRKTLPGK
jgi:RNA polymerase sigma factor (sigma-70 family)